MPDRWEILEQHPLLDCSPWFTVRREVVRLEDGETVVPDFYLIDAPSYAMVFAITADGQIPLIEQYKHAAGKRIFELPAGYVSPGEDPLMAARRELFEETGYAAPEWKPLGSFIVDGNRGFGSCHAFLALRAVKTAEPDSGDLQQQIIHLLDTPTLRHLWLDGSLGELASVAVVGLGLAMIEKNGWQPR
jgi:ADP-ribose pyrophosphatase